MWDEEIIPNLTDYIRIPNKSRAFDPDWQDHGYMNRAVEQFAAWARAKGAAMMGEGGSIPFMGMLGEKYPKAQFVITGVLGPHSSAHGPNESLHIAMGKGVPLAVWQVLANHFAR